MPASAMTDRVEVSIHVPLAEHDTITLEASSPSLVSIHVPLAEHDASRLRRGRPLEVSIHVPLAEHDAAIRQARISPSMFQFTCPSRSTTIDDFSVMMDSSFQFTCPSRSTT